VSNSYPTLSIWRTTSLFLAGLQYFSASKSTTTADIMMKYQQL
jgi:hypothetical protein